MSKTYRSKEIILQELQHGEWIYVVDKQDKEIKIVNDLSVNEFIAYLNSWDESDLDGDILFYSL